MKNKIQKILVHFTLALIKTLEILGKNFFTFILKPLFKVGKIFSRFIFYRIIVKSYKFYLFIIKKVGWSHFKRRSLLFLFNQKPLHLIVVCLTLIFVFSNLAAKTKAQDIDFHPEKTILATLIENEFSTPEEEQLIEEFFDQEAIISSLQQSYLENLSAVRPQPIASLDEEQSEIFSDKGSMRNNGQAIKSQDVASTKNQENQAILRRTETIYYTVESGDTISMIAARFGISVSTILWENDLSAYSIIRPGNKLAILPESGITHTIKKGDTLNGIANTYDISVSSIMQANKINNADKLALGQKIILPGGKKSYPTRNTPKYSGIDAIKNFIKPENARPIAGNMMQWPTVGHRITQYYSWRHQAVDIANKTGTPLYAADSGTVEYAGWGNGYGNEIIINHGGGKKTRYAHASRLLVAKGEAVSKGETIALMGSTGWSTGPHIHFEIIINGVKYNPLNYIK